MMKFLGKLRSLIKIKRAIFFSLLFLLLFSPYGQFSYAKKPTIQLGQAKIKKSPLAFIPLFYEGEVSPSLSLLSLKVGRELFQTIQNDLTISALFRFASEKEILSIAKSIPSFSYSFLSPSKDFPYEEWRKDGFDFVIQGLFSIKSGRSGDNVELRIVLYSAFHKKAILKKTYLGSLHLNSYRKLGHTFANDVVEVLTGKKSFFLTKIVTSRWSSKNRHKEIVLLDWDGENPLQISNHKSIATSPAWSPDGKSIAYTAFLYHKRRKTRNADLLLFDFEKNKTTSLVRLKGVNSGAVFHPFRNFLFFTSSSQGYSDIYKLSLSNRKLKRVIRGPYRSINVEPAFSPSGKEIAFSSDRGGRPTIYLMKANGKNVRKLISVGKYNASPAWSPHGKQIVFSGFDKNRFDLFIINKDGSHLTRLTSAKKKNGKWANNEDPSFSPDGRRILFISDRTGSRELYMIRPDGSDERRMSFDEYNYERAKWSPFFR